MSSLMTARKMISLHERNFAIVAAIQPRLPFDRFEGDRAC